MQDFQFIGSYDRRTTAGTINAENAHQMVKASKPKRQQAKTWQWKDCRAMAKVLKVLIGYDHIEFPNYEGKFVTASAFENGKRYSYKHHSPSQCYEALLLLQRDRLARLSDAEAIAAGQQAKQLFN